MITVSTSILPERNYHHGDLRKALVEAGLAALNVADSEALSLRALARDVGVSATAVYRHFPDKQALLAALAAEGIILLGNAQRIAADAVGGGNAGFAATGRAYVRFAIANPALFRLMFTHAETLASTVPGDHEAGRMLHANAIAKAGSAHEARRVEVQSWAIAHGLAMLILDGRLPPSDSLIDEIVG